MSGYQQIRNALEAARSEEDEYKAACVAYVRKFCDGFASRCLGVPCGKDTRHASGVRDSTENVAYLDPPRFKEETGSVETHIRVDNHRVDISVRRLGGTFTIKAVDREFDGSDLESAFRSIKDAIIEHIESTAGWKRWPQSEPRVRDRPPE